MSKLEIAGFKLMAFLALVAGITALTMPPKPNTLENVLDEAKAIDVSYLDKGMVTAQQDENARKVLETFGDIEPVDVLFADNYCRYYPKSKSCKKKG